MRKSYGTWRARRWASTGVPLLATLVAAILVVPVPAGARAAAAPEAGTSVSAEETALAAAKRSGRVVEVVGSTSEAARVVATPEGSLVLETYAAPRWTARRDGTGWQQIDTALHLEGGSVVPNATLADVSFSSGGTGPMASVAVSGGQVALSWPEALPSPRLEGDTAVYESVRPQVDLRVRALADGFTWSLVVYSAQAAMDPTLETLRFRLDTVGLTRRERADGGFEVLDAAGQPVLGAGNALMWDASGVTASPGARAAVSPEQQREALESAPEQSQQAELPVNLDGVTTSSSSRTSSCCAVLRRPIRW